MMARGQNTVSTRTRTFQFQGQSSFHPGMKDRYYLQDKVEVQIFMTGQDILLSTSDKDYS